MSTFRFYPITSSLPPLYVQSLMELGATVCTVKNPSCSACPISNTCRARALTTIGQKPQSKDISTVSVDGAQSLTAVVQHSGTLRNSGDKVIKREGRGDNGSGVHYKAPKGVELRGGRQTCGCAVCEVDEDGRVLLPLAVTDFPRKSAKT